MKLIFFLHKPKVVIQNVVERIHVIHDSFTTAVETTSDERPENAFGLLEYCARARQAIDTIMSLLQSFYDPDVDGVHTHMHTYCAHVCMHTHMHTYCAHVCMHTHMHTYCAHVCMHTHKQSFKHT